MAGALLLRVLRGPRISITGASTALRTRADLEFEEQNDHS